MRMAFTVILQQYRNLISREEGQDMVEYALVVALIALGITAGMNSLATALSNAFTSIGSSVSSNV